MFGPFVKANNVPDTEHDFELVVWRETQGPMLKTNDDTLTSAIQDPIFTIGDTLIKYEYVAVPTCSTCTHAGECFIRKLEAFGKLPTRLFMFSSMAAIRVSSSNTCHRPLRGSLQRHTPDLNIWNQCLAMCLPTVLDRKA